MRLDLSRPHGTIVGHAEARYEQEGMLFDGAGNLLGGGEVEKVKAKPGPKPKVSAAASAEAPADINTRQLSNAQDFLRGLLAGGPVSKAAVYTEAESNNQHWDTVKTAFAALNGRTQKRNGAELWALLPE